MKQGHYNYPARKSRACKSTDLTSVLTRWQRAVSAFQSLYETLSHTITERKQQDHTAACYGVVYGSSQLPISELERVRTGMIQELKWLLDDMAESGNSTEDVNQASIRRLHGHTLQLQKQAQRIQQILDYRSNVTAHSEKRSA